MISFPLLGWLRWTRSGKRICPHCGSNYVGLEDITGSLLEICLVLLRLRAYRCDDCYRRHFGHISPVRSEPMAESHASR